MEKGVAAVKGLVLDMYVRQTERLNVRTIYSLDIHIHNDFRFGSLDLIIHPSGLGYTTATSNLPDEKLYNVAMFTSGTDAWIED